MRVLRPGLAGGSPAVFALGAALTVVAAFGSVWVGAQISLGALILAVVFVGATIGFVSYPHLTVAGVVVLFGFLPTLKVFVGPEIGSLKEVVVAAAVAAATILFAFERRRPDERILLLVGILLALYVINAGGTYNLAWAQGVRLIAEPLLLLVVGLTLPDPRRTLRYALGALVATGCVVAAYGMLQQAVGEWTLVGWGYEFSQQVRTIDGRLRSFGTFDDPFAYAAFLLFGIAAVVFWLRRGTLAWTAGLLMLMGLGLSFVRTAALILVAFVGLQLGRWGYTPSGVLVVTATIIAGGAILSGASGTRSQTYSVAGAGGGSANVILNGRVSAWEAALGDEPRSWLLGRGVGEVGTAAERSQYRFGRARGGERTQTLAVDSGYLAVIADVGLVGLAVLLLLFARLLVLAERAARLGSNVGWATLGLLIVLMLDALTRASFTGFPTAFLGLFLVGIALAAVRAESESPDGRATVAAAAG
ncbi:MAG TPA: hypothetical protein VNB64_09385 [Solirubrobacteraceae bacterium]|nr:hypothetical protein [Solirubrobacteraceae bacterium]